MSSYPHIFSVLYRLLPVRMQDLLVSFHGRRRWVYERGANFQKLVGRLRRMQSANQDEIDAYIKTKIKAVLLAAKQTDHYSEKLPTEITIEKDPVHVLQGIPVLERDEVRADPRRFVNRKYRGKLIQHGTSGTTGTPLQIFWTPECIDWERALIWRHRLETGLRYGDVWRGMLGGHQIVPLKKRNPPFWRVNRSAKQVYFSTYHISDRTARDYYDSLIHFNVKFLEGYPSVLFALASCLHRNGLSLPMKGVYFGAEPMLDHYRSLIEKVFSCHAWDYYGLTERVASATEYSCMGGLHENWENCYLEITDSTGERVSEGEYGELLGTSFSNLGFPLLRYRTGDMTRFVTGKCSCGRSSRRIEPVDTKREDLLIMPDGSLLSASNLTYPFKEVEHILESQLHQSSPEILEVRFVPSPQYDEADGRKLVNGLSRILPESVKIELREVSRIERTIGGKYRFCISEISRQTGSDEEL